MIRDADINRLQTDSQKLRTGQIGEHLVCADILLAGYEAHLAAQGCAYDVVADIGTCMVRLQVKTVCRMTDYRPEGRHASTEAYTWNTYQGGARTPAKRYLAVDAFALVALDGPYIAYLESEFVAMKVRLSPPGTPLERRRGEPMRTMAAFPFSRLVEDLNAVA